VGRGQTEIALAPPSTPKLRYVRRQAFSNLPSPTFFSPGPTASSVLLFPRPTNRTACIHRQAAFARRGTTTHRAHQLSCRPRRSCRGAEEERGLTPLPWLTLQHGDVVSLWHHRLLHARTVAAQFGLAWPSHRSTEGKSSGHRCTAHGCAGVLGCQAAPCRLPGVPPPWRQSPNELPRWLPTAVAKKGHLRTHAVQKCLRPFAVAAARFEAMVAERPKKGAPGYAWAPAWVTWSVEWVAWISSPSRSCQRR
jgi:hypothetical protein